MAWILVFFGFHGILDSSSKGYFGFGLTPYSYRGLNQNQTSKPNSKENRQGISWRLLFWEIKFGG